MVSGGGGAKMSSGEHATLTVRGKQITLPVHEDTFENVFVDIRRVLRQRLGSLVLRRCGWN